jgi:hypothetical protein
MPIVAALPYIFMGISALGTISAMQGAKQEGQAQQKAFEYNAAINEQEAQAIETRTATEEEQKRRDYARLMGSQRAGYAAAGVDLSSGTPLDVLTEQAYQAEKDIINTRYTGAVEATSKRNQATLNRYYGEQAVTAANTKENTTLFQGIGNLGLAYYGGKTTKGNIPTKSYYGPGAY